VKELTEIVHSVSTSGLVLIDGAHAPGQIQVNVTDIAADFYLGNCHKWLYAPKGTAFLWVTPAQQLSASPEPTVISSSGKHDFLGRYSYTGTRDYTGFAALPAAFDFRDYLGGNDRIMGYCHDLAVRAGHMLARKWLTALLVYARHFEIELLFFTRISSRCNIGAGGYDRLHGERYLAFDRP
jgi:isopenicillin-N epimerase